MTLEHTRSVKTVQKAMIHINWENVQLQRCPASPRLLNGVALIRNQDLTFILIFLKMMPSSTTCHASVIPVRAPE